MISGLDEAKFSFIFFKIGFSGEEYDLQDDGRRALGCPGPDNPPQPASPRMLAGPGRPPQKIFRYSNIFNLLP
jgi:hypothetical protein